jgi:hypothetical protein
MDASMKMKLFFVFLMPFFLLCASPGHFMSNIWPQKNIPTNEYGDLKASKRVLIGGLESPFKEAIVKSIVDSLVKDSVYVKTVSLKRLKREEPTKWNAILILNYCMAWEINYKVKKYISSFPQYHGFVVITTSGDSTSCPAAKKLPENVDAISTASEDQKLPEISAHVLDLLREKIN